MIGIYKIENLVNAKVYIGQSKNIGVRFEQHRDRLTKDKHENTYLQRAWNKYGEENFKFEIIEECEEDKLTEREQYWIDYYGGINSDNTYNSKSAKDSVMFSDAVRKQMSKTHKENPNRYWLGRKRDKNTIEKMRNSLIEHYKNNPVSKETRQKLSLASQLKETNLTDEQIQKRREHGKLHKGWKPTEETRKRMSESAKNRIRIPMSEETKQKLSIALTGIKRGPMSEERKQYLSDKLKGRKREDWEIEKISNSLKGKPLSEQHKQALKEAWVRRKANGKGTAWNKGLTKQKVEECRNMN